MGANPGKRDAWPPFPRARLVLVRRPPYRRPAQGLVIEWARRRSAWVALVAYVDDDLGRGGGAELGWFAVDELVPVRVDPNTAAVLPDQHRRRLRGGLELGDLGDY